jgi:membrane protease YdiL (CAAX protease family)
LALNSFAATPAGGPLLHFLLGGFGALVVGLAVVTRRRPIAALGADPHDLRRASGFAVAYILGASAFARVLDPALLGRERSPWLLALGDVLFVTCGLYAWVITLAERRPWSEYGFRWGPPGRMALALALGALVAALFVYPSFAEIAAGRVSLSADTVVYALGFAAFGSALPEELLFRGYLQGSLTSSNRWLRIGVPALAFTLLRGFRFLPGQDLSLERWLLWVLGMVLPLGLWWGFLRDVSRGSLWPSLASNFLIQFGAALAASSPVSGNAPL